MKVVQNQGKNLQLQKPRVLTARLSESVIERHLMKQIPSSLPTPPLFKNRPIKQQRNQKRPNIWNRRTSAPFLNSKFSILTRKIFSLCLKGIKLMPLFFAGGWHSLVEISNCQIILHFYWWYKQCVVLHIENEKMQDNVTCMLSWHLF